MNYIDILPDSLNELKNPPKKLYFKGNLELLNRPLVAIVGSRRPNAYTKRLTISLASKLSKRGVCVVSGLAMGVDALSHQGSFPNTIAVLGNSLDVVYPKINVELFTKIAENSLMLSEYEPKTTASPWSFVQRNRIVVALSSAVVIAQADIKSGSMHSANFAVELNKPLFVLPQRMGESDGTNMLLKQNKATLIDDIDKFCDLFGENNDFHDEIISFCKQNPLLEDALKKFGEAIYEYELDGKLEINGIHVRVLV